ncbi:MAG TPA: CheR family methyltransferase [Anaeromyxobacteraceae bacterium]|nr:CheR family methyltransferase [Anaeromyxobacteraceae bacterium]
MRTVGSEQLGDLAALLKERVGLHIRPDGQSALKLAVSARLDEMDGELHDARGYLALLRSEGGDEELRRLLPLVTVGKTSFFRDERQFGALRALLPGLLARPKGGGRPVTAWSAGCATGEEPYSIAMCAGEAGAGPEHVEILATDVNPEAVAAAARGSFDSRRVRDIPAEMLGRYFDPEGDHFRVRANLRRYIAAIRPHNLVSALFPRPTEGGWDLIFCRNVIIYFDTPTTQRVLQAFHDALAPGGYLFLGYSESLFRLFEGFELTEVAGAFLYRRPEGGAARGPFTTPRPVVPVPRDPPPVRHVEVAAEAPPPGRQREGRRGRSERGHATFAATPPSGTLLLAPQEFLDGAVALFSDGRFGAARELLERLLERSGEDLAVRLTLANLYGVLRQPDLARRCYVAALAIEPLSAEAHLFYGIHLLSAGESDPAALELSRALFLDPDLSLAHYFLGRCREAQRDLARARLAYRNAIEAHRRRPDGKRQAFLGYYPDIPEDGAAFARAAQYALAAL